MQWFKTLFNYNVDYAYALYFNILRPANNLIESILLLPPLMSFICISSKVGL